MTTHSQAPEPDLTLNLIGVTCLAILSVVALSFRAIALSENATAPAPLETLADRHQ
ncbi:MAG: hypothetical protein ACFB0C_03245 [Leptolyngbyaceae cyanobacterium]